MWLAPIAVGGSYRRLSPIGKTVFPEIFDLPGPPTALLSLECAGSDSLNGGEFLGIRPNGAIRRQLGTLFNLGTIGELTDGQLLERFSTRSAEAAEMAFAALVERHGPMVLRVCRNTLRDPDEVQDAFQATFLVLVQKARSLWVRDSLGPWLHRVAYRVATRARSSAARRRKHERRAAATRQTLVSNRADWDDTVALLHEEIDRLPERYRVPVVICDLQGLTHEKAARHLGWPVGTVKSRLARARELLRDRLSRRDLEMPAGLLTAGKGLGGAFPAVECVVPGALVESTVQAAAPFAAGKALAVGVISTRVAILIEEVLKTMFLTKLKLASAVVLLIGAAGAAGVLAQPRAGSAASPAADQSQEPASADSRRAPGVDPAPAPAPAYITQSRAMIITRLEEEVAEARARLDRTLRKVRSPEDPAVIHARKTFEDLQQRLDRIDRVLVDMVETYPTMFDFSGGPADTVSSSSSPSSSHGKIENAGNRPSVESPYESDHARAYDRAKWAQGMFEKGYISRSQLDAELENSQKTNAPSEAKRPQKDAQQGGQESGNSGLPKGQGYQSPDRRDASQGKQGNQKQDQSPEWRNAGQGKQGNAQQDQSPDRRNAGQGKQGNPQQDKSSDTGKRVPGESADWQQGKSPARGEADPRRPGQDQGKGSQGSTDRDP